METDWIWRGGYDKIPHLEDIEDLMRCQSVVVMEKIHGLCWFIGCLPSEASLLYADRWNIQDKTGSLAHIVKWFENQEIWIKNIRLMAHQINKPLVIVGEVFGDKVFGEAAVDSYGTIIPYLDYGCDFNFCVHDIRVEEMMPWSEVEDLAQKMSLAVAPVFYKGVPSLSVFEHFLGKTQLVCNGQSGEGLIIRSDPPKRDETGRVLIGKMKVGEYSEINRQITSPLAIPPGAGAAERFSIEFVTEQRVAKGVERLIADGLFTGTREDIFPLTDWVMSDVQIEAQASWADVKNAELTGEEAIRKQIQKMVKYWIEHTLRRKLL